MSESENKSFEVLVIGAGPAGLMAAEAAASCGRQVGLLDENRFLGGQIWRSPAERAHPEALRRFAILQKSGVEFLLGVNVVHGETNSRTLFAETDHGRSVITYSKLILATGARERFLPFPGWTLPNVMAAGGLQAMVSSGLPINGKRVVVAGSGPLLLAVAAHLHDAGALVQGIYEQTSWLRLARFGCNIFADRKKASQALGLLHGIRKVSFRANSWPLCAVGNRRLEAVILSVGRKRLRIACDYLACGFHLVPNNELPRLLGCTLKDGSVEVDENQQTSIPNVYCVGELTGIGGLEAALLSGEAAGMSAAGRIGQISRKRKRRVESFNKHLSIAFSMRRELKALPDDDTIVCRCEDVTHQQLTRYESMRAAKLQTRCGMGPCQSRVCGPATQFLYGWKPDAVRPPIFPIRLQNLADLMCGAAEVASQRKGEKE